jgi:imidazolonepropionase-like amidohydrolase
MLFKQSTLWLHAILLLQLGFAGCALAGEEPQSNFTPTPDRNADTGAGPYKRLIIRGATVIDGTGAPPAGPMDIVIEDNRIVDIVSVGYPLAKIDASKRPQNATQEIDAHGAYVMPGLVDLHVHTLGNKITPPEDVYKLWLAHGITTVRGVPLGPLEWSLSEKKRSERNDIAAPRIIAYQGPGQGKAWKGKKIQTPEDAKKWVKYAAKQGVDGLKLSSHRPAIMKALLDEAKKQKLGSTAHLHQTGVAQMNVLDAARLGLGSMTHYYGLFQSLYKDYDIQPYPVDMNYMNEQDRFGQVARQWNLVHERGSKEWNALIDELLALDFYINPTMAIYAASRDLMRARNADWHQQYTLPTQWKFYQASRAAHGSYWYYWTTEDEVAWKNFYRVWMSFLNDYKNKGGKVTLGSDSGFIYSLYGFGTIQELEMMQEAGFHPLEVIRAATMYSAMEIAKPTGKPIEYGVLRAGMLADLIIVDENPLKNLKVLYGTGAEKLNDNTGKVERVGGVKYTIKDGIVYDAKKLLSEVTHRVAEEKMKTKDMSSESVK